MLCGFSKLIVHSFCNYLPPSFSFSSEPSSFLLSLSVLVSLEPPSSVARKDFSSANFARKPPSCSSKPDFARRKRSSNPTELDMAAALRAINFSFSSAEANGTSWKAAKERRSARTIAEARDLLFTSVAAIFISSSSSSSFCAIVSAADRRKRDKMASSKDNPALSWSRFIRATFSNSIFASKKMPSSSTHFMLSCKESTLPIDFAHLSIFASSMANFRCISVG
mmetsp:Transcript_6811/g.20353  ORF Transcript_6811/g.20353 Transcript_6811/m.20353 type:complete len:224 (+) Transcript_6811:79-750(+)